MEGREAIIERILSDAEEKASKMKAETMERVDAKVHLALKWVQEYNLEEEKNIAEESEAVVSRRETVAQLDCRKLLLKTKREIIEEVFKIALEKACAFEGKKYLEVIERLLNGTAERGDGVLLAAGAPVTEEDLSKMPVFKEKQLKFLGREEKLQGGIMLCGKECDKDLSFGAIIRESANELERDAVNLLFCKNAADGEKNA